MANWDRATKSNLSAIDFKTYLQTERQRYDEHRAVYRDTPAEQEQIITNLTNRRNQLRMKIAAHCFQKASNASNIAVFIATKCEISESLYKKVLSGGRLPTAEFVGRICVGLKLTMKESEELFELMGLPLEFGKNWFTSVTMVAIRDQDPISDYSEDLKYYESMLKGR